MRPGGAIGTKASSSSLTSLTFSANRRRASCFSSSQWMPYSFIIAPQPAWLTTTASKSSTSKAATLASAILRAPSLLPAW